jgi:thiamine biosynthesis lipoprotein ApbE
VLSMRPRGAGTPLNVDALGKAYILDHAAAAVRASPPHLGGLLRNIGGDIVAWGRDCEVAVADPNHADDNAEPLTHVVLRDGAVATSGCYARGPHLIDGRTGSPAPTTASATVVARDAVTANALATTLCLVGAEEGLHLVELCGHRPSHLGISPSTPAGASRQYFRPMDKASSLWFYTAIEVVTSRALGAATL